MNLSENYVLVAEFQDFEGVYENVNHQVLLAKLANLGLPPKLVFFIKCFIKNRNFIVCIGSAFSPKTTITKGLPQGAVLSCLIFFLFLWDFTVCWRTGIMLFCNTFGFAKVTFPIWKNSQKSDLPIAPSKSKIIQFDHKAKNFNAKQTLNGIIIPEDNNKITRPYTWPKT